MAALLQPSHLEFDKFKLGKSKNAVKLYYDKKPPQLRTCKVYVPFGAKVNKFKTYTGFSEYYLECSVDKTDGEGQEFIRAMDNLDDRIVELMAESMSLFSVDKEYNASEIQERFSGILRKSDNYNPLFKVVLPRDKNGQFDFSIFDEHKEFVPVNDSNIEDLLGRGKSFKAIVEVDKCWAFKEKFGVQLRLVQLRFAAASAKTATATATVEKDGTSVEKYMMLDD